MVQKEPVYEVTKVELALRRTNPPTLDIRAKGRVRTLNWSDPELARRIYITPPADGIQEFDFVAAPPTGPTGPTVSPVDAVAEMLDLPSWLVGVRVIAETNSHEVPLPEAS
ncbi:MAG: hypothetical protein ACK47B_22670 [Armatimonadota bacterium]